MAEWIEVPGHRIYVISGHELRDGFDYIGENGRPATRAKPTNKATTVLIAMRDSLLRFIAGCPERFSLPLVHRIWHRCRHVTDCISDPSSTCDAPSRFCLEQTRPYALCSHCLPGSSAGESAKYRKGNGAVE
jgi:hypothetical protein